GDFEPSEALSVLARTFEGWKNPQPYARVERPFQPGLKPTRETISTPDKANASYFAGLTLEMKDSDPDYPALVAGNYILGGGALSSRIACGKRADSRIPPPRTSPPAHLIPGATC